MGILDRFRKKPDVVLPVVETKPVAKEEYTPPADGIYLPAVCTRQDDMIIVSREYFSQWLREYPDSIMASSKMIAFLKKNYPAITRFQIRK